MNEDTPALFETCGVITTLLRLTRTADEAPGARYETWTLDGVNVLGSTGRSNCTKNPVTVGAPVTGSGVLMNVGPPGTGDGMASGVATPIVLLTIRGPAAIRIGAIRT